MRCLLVRSDNGSDEYRSLASFTLLVLECLNGKEGGNGGEWEGAGSG